MDVIRKEMEIAPTPDELRDQIARGVEDGIRGMQFIDTMVSAGYDDKVKWVKFGE